MSFDLLAPVYSLMERLTAGGKMQCCRTAYLDEITPPRRVLTLGEGHGRFLCACRRRFPEAEITCVDSSAAMLAQARRALAKQGMDDRRVHFIQDDILSWSPTRGTFDLVVTHYFLDCFRADQLAAIVPHIASAAADDASWLLADFQVAAQGWRRRRSACILALMYAFFRVFTRLPAKELTPPEPFLSRAGFSPHRHMEMEWGLMKSAWWRRSGSLEPSPFVS